VSFRQPERSREPDDTAKASARFQGRRLADIAAQFLAGRAASSAAAAADWSKEPQPA
jgi:hypothetical protein